MIRFLKLGIPIVVLAVGIYGAWTMIQSRPQVETRPPEVQAPLVRTLEVQRQDIRLKVRSQGTVAPRSESTLVPEVSGRVTYISPSLAAGGFFEQDDVLLRIDRRDYEFALVRAQAEVAQAELRLEQERAESEVARTEWSDLGRGEATPLVLREPQLSQALAALEGAGASVEKAELDLSRTEILAPFAGRVREENVDVGQFVNRGTPIATLYSVDYAEVRLPLPDGQLAYLDLPLVYRGEDSERPMPKVVLRATFAGREYTWSGRLVRTEGEIDPGSRMVQAIAQVGNPYGRTGDRNRPPLAVGLYVEAEIHGRYLRNVAVIPRAVVRGKNTLLIVDSDKRLHFRDVEVLRADREQVIVGSGLESGELICVSPLEIAVENMQVRVVEEDAE